MRVDLFKPGASPEAPAVLVSSLPGTPTQWAPTGEEDAQEFANAVTMSFAGVSDLDAQLVHRVSVFTPALFAPAQEIARSLPFAEKNYDKWTSTLHFELGTLVVTTDQERW